MFIGSTGWKVENSKPRGRVFSCSLMLNSISVSATMFKVDLRGDRRFGAVTDLKREFGASVVVNEGIGAASLGWAENVTKHNT